MGLEHEQRWNRARALTPYGFLIVAVIASLTGDTAGRPGTLALAAVLAVWHGWFILLHPQWWERWLWRNGVYFAGFLVLTAVLVRRDEAFHLLIPACYLIPFLALPGWTAYLGLLAANLPTLAAAGGDRVSVLIAVGVVTPGAALIGGIVRAMEREAIRRRRVTPGPGWTPPVTWPGPVWTRCAGRSTRCAPARCGTPGSATRWGRP